MNPESCDNESNDRPPLVERRGEDGVVYVEHSDRGSWEDTQRSRSYPQSLEVYCGALSFLLLWISTLGALLSIVMIFSGYREPWTAVGVLSLILLAISLMVALSISLTKRCPLCHGTPLHSRNCRKHRLSQKWPLLTKRASVVLSILTTLNFRCMYCGTPFRLFKKSSRHR